MKTKDIILEQARDLISEVGFHKTTTSILAKRANISEGTIYRHFESKDDILLHILTELDGKYGVFIQTLRDQEDGRGCTVDEALRQHHQFVADNDTDIKIMLSSYFILDSSRNLMESVVKRLLDFFTECLNREQEAGRVVKDIDVGKTAWMIIIFMFGLSRANLYWPDQVGEFREEAVAFCSRSLKP